MFKCSVQEGWQNRNRLALGEVPEGHPQTRSHLAQFDTVGFERFLPSLTLWLSPNCLTVACAKHDHPA